MNDSAKAFANRLRKEGGDKHTSQVQLGLRIVLSRDPTEKEVKAGEKMIGDMKIKFNLTDEEALNRFALLALNLNEFVYLD